MLLRSSYSSLSNRMRKSVAIKWHGQDERLIEYGFGFVYSLFYSIDHFGSILYLFWRSELLFFFDQKSHLVTPRKKIYNASKSSRALGTIVSTRLINYEVTNKANLQRDILLFNHLKMCYGVFFSTKKCALYFKKNKILCLFLKNVSPSKRVVCFILNNLHIPMVEVIAFYALQKSRVLIIPC